MHIADLRAARRGPLAATATLFAGLVAASAPTLTSPATAAPDPSGPGWVTGVVVDTAGAPVEGAMVNVLPPREVPERGILDETTDRWTVTDAQGRFRVRQAQQGFLVQVCDHDEERPWACAELSEAEHLVRYVGPDGGYDSWLQHTDLYDASEADLGLGSIEVQPPARIHGAIAGAENAQVRVMRLNDTVAYNTEADARGRYAFEGLAPGAYYVAAGGFGTLPWRSEPVVIDADEPTRVDGTVAAGTTLAGRMVERRSGEPARRTDVFLADADGDLIASTVTTRRGAFRFTGLTPGDYRVGTLLVGGDYVKHAQRVTVAEGDTRVSTTVRVTRGATATIRFTGADGRLGDELRDARGNVLETNRGRSGAAAYTGLRPGTYTIAAKDGDGYGLRTFRIRDQRDHDLGRLRLDKKLLTIRGRTAPGAVIEATTGDLCPPDAPETYGGFHEISDRADANGRYVLKGLVPGDWMVGADGWPANYAPICHEDVKIWTSRRYDVPLAAGHTVTGRLVYEGTTLPVITTLGYELAYPAGLATNPTAEHPARARTRGGSGRFTIDRLSTGTVTGGVATAQSEGITHPSFLVLYPFQDGTPYWLETEPRSIDVAGDVALGEIDLVLRTGAEELQVP